MIGFLRRFRLSAWVVIATIVAVAMTGGSWLRLSMAEDSGAAEVSRASQVRPSSLQAAPVPMQRPKRQTALFLGDDFAAGSDGLFVYTYPNIVCDILNLNCNVDAQFGTGFIADGAGAATGKSRLVDRLAADQQIFAADLVVVDAGRNDVGASPDALAQAVRDCLAEVRRLWPEAKLAVIAPAPFAAQPDALYQEFLSTVAPIVEGFGGVLIDPIEEGWYDNVDRSILVASDGIHPAQGGHQQIGQKLSESLIEHGLAIDRGVVGQ